MHARRLLPANLALRFILSHAYTTLHIHLLASQHTNCALITMAFRGRSPPRLKGTDRPVIPYGQLTPQQLALYAAVVHHIDHNTRLPTPPWKGGYESLIFWLITRAHFTSGAMAPRHDWDAHRLWQFWRSSPEGPSNHVRINTRRYTLQQRAPESVAVPFCIAIRTVLGDRVRHLISVVVQRHRTPGDPRDIPNQCNAQARGGRCPTCGVQQHQVLRTSCYNSDYIALVAGLVDRHYSRRFSRSYRWTDRASQLDHGRPS